MGSTFLLLIFVASHFVDYVNTQLPVSAPACTFKRRLYVRLMIVGYKKRCPTFQMCVSIWVPNWGRRHSCWIKLPLGGWGGKAPSPSDQKWTTTTTGCAVPSQFAWSFLRFQLYLVVLLYLLLPYCDLCFIPVGFFLTYFTFILRAFSTVTIFLLQASVLRAASSALNPNLPVVVISEKLRAWSGAGVFRFSVKVGERFSLSWSH